MSTPFLAELKIISWNFPPKGWAFANGQLLPINQNQALFSLMGTMYGGDGRVNFGLPDLRGRAPIHMGAGFTEGQAAGQEFHTLTISELPSHNHFVTVNGAANSTDSPSGTYLAKAAENLYGAFAAPAPMNPASVSNYGGSQPHENRQPFLVLNYIVALVGIFPSQN